MHIMTELIKEHIKGLEDRAELAELRIAAVREQIMLMPQSGSGYDYWVNKLSNAVRKTLS